MSRDPDHHRVIRVLREETYLLPMADAATTMINGWTPAEVREDWFERHAGTMFHATRDTYRVGNGDKILHARVEYPLPGELNPGPQPDRNPLPEYYALLYAANSASARHDCYDVSSDDPASLEKYKRLSRECSEAQRSLIQYVLVNFQDLQRSFADESQP